MIFLIIVGVMVVWLGIGAKVGRVQYTELMRKYNASDSREIARTLAEKQMTQENINHESYCNLRYSYISSRGCDCRQSNKWWPLYREIARLEAGKMPEPKVPYRALVTWPGVMVESYLKGGTKKLPDYARIKELEELIKD